MNFRKVANILGAHLKFYGFQPDTDQEHSSTDMRCWQRGPERLRFIWDPADRVCRMEHKGSAQDQWQQLVEVPVKLKGRGWFPRFEWGRVDGQVLPSLNDYLSTGSTDRPLFPLTIQWLDSMGEIEEEEEFDSVVMAYYNLEFFDFEPGDVRVHDRNGRPVRLTVNIAKGVFICEFEQHASDR